MSPALGRPRAALAAAEVVQLVTSFPSEQGELLSRAHGLHLLIDDAAANYLATPEPIIDARRYVIDDEPMEQPPFERREGDKHDEPKSRSHDWNPLNVAAVKASTMA